MSIETGGSNVQGYYETADNSKTGYKFGVLGRDCHFGYSPEGCDQPYDLKVAQHNLRKVVGQTLALPQGSRILDAGCGFGPASRTLAEEFGLDVTGIDLMHPRLVDAQELNREIGLRQINLSEADYHNLPFASGSFDGLFTLETWVHSNPFSKSLSEFKRVLKPGGRLVMFEYSIPDLNTVPRPIRSVADYIIDRTSMTSLPYFIHGSFPSYLEKAGFENIQVDDISENVYPTWRFLWLYALKDTARQFIHGELSPKSLKGTTFIYPARKKLKYNVISANKPR